MIPSNLENKKKRVVAKDIEDKKGKRMTDYQEEFEYLTAAGVALEVLAISNPVYFVMFMEPSKSDSETEVTI